MKEILFLLFFVSFSLTAWAQDSKPVVLTFNHMALSVKNLDRSVQFYSTVLNLKEITNRGRMDGVRWFSLGDGKELHLIAIVKEPVIVNKAVHLALTTADFDEFIKVLDKRKIAYSDWPGTKGIINLRSDGVKQVFLQDPDGYWIEVNSAAKK